MFGFKFPALGSLPVILSSLLSHLRISNPRPGLRPSNAPRCGSGIKLSLNSFLPSSVTNCDVFFDYSVILSKNFSYL